MLRAVDIRNANGSNEAINFSILQSGMVRDPKLQKAALFLDVALGSI